MWPAIYCPCPSTRDGGRKLSTCWISPISVCVFLSPPLSIVNLVVQHRPSFLPMRKQFGAHSRPKAWGASFSASFFFLRGLLAAASGISQGARNPQITTKDFSL
eukprot:m.24993 g.24993  ORF g.24993 m.24993 type:complete len:104 (-) comp4367_c0_seq1:7-318(-)